MTELNEQRTKVFLDRYALKDTDGIPVEGTPEEMWDRVAHSIGTTDDERREFRRILQDFKFVPGGRILAGAGTNTEVTYYNCYVIPIETKARRENRATSLSWGTDLGWSPLPDPGSDSREAILDTISVMVDIMSRGGGVGINWSVLRPKGTHLSRVNGTTSGPVSWMDVASHAVQTVTQGGSRRGAAMFMLDDWHPDVLEFINAKRDHNKITGANVSVAVSDALMDAVEHDTVWVFGFPDTSHPAYNTEWDGDLRGWAEKGYPVIEHGEIAARQLWRKIAEAAWDNGEPGIVFLDRYNDLSTAKGTERIICVNPCGEQGLGPYSVCNLGSINLNAYIRDKKTYTMKTGAEFDWAGFIKDVETSVVFLDNVVDQNYYFLPENEAVQKDLRRIGLGVMGLADALIRLGLRYGSDEAIEFTDRVFGTMRTAAIRRSCDLAQQKGKAPAWDLKSTYKRPYFADYMGTPLGTQIRKYGLRNMFLLTQAPTGSTSILAGVNSGIEPYFAFEYTRKDRTGTHKVYAPILAEWEAEHKGVGVPSYYVTSAGVTVEEHIAMQAAVQRYVDSSVSKTINAPNEHTIEDVERAYTLAYKSGLKGLAYFRDGNGREQVLYKEDPDAVPAANAEPDESVHELARLRAENEYLLSTIADLGPDLIEFDRPDVLSGTTQKVATRAGSAYVTVNRDADTGRPVEVFFNVGKAGSEVAAMAEALGRLASLALRKGATIGGVANQLDGVGGTSQFNRSIPHAISTALTVENKRAFAKVADEPKVQLTVSNPDGDFEFEGVLKSSEPRGGGRFDICPECHNASLSYQEGCSKCALCGYSAC